MSAIGKGARSRPVRNAPPVGSRFPDMAPNGYREEEAQASLGANGSSPRVDLSKLNMPALRKYTKVYEIPGVSQLSSKEDLRSAVAKHWDETTVSEESVLQNLMRIRGRY